MSDKKILCCPLMSAGHTIEVLCSQERCAWYIKNYKMCSMHVVAHNAALEVQAKQRKK
ncbi:MAG: hypothetical protein WCG95_05090 [bacterium]